jgi:hypothetical protein
MNAAIHPMQFDLFDIPVLLAPSKPRLVHSSASPIARHTRPHGSRSTDASCIQLSHDASSECRKVIAMATAHTSLGFHERSLFLLTTLARLDATAAANGYASLPDDHRLKALWEAFGPLRARFCASLFPVFALIAEPCLRLCLTEQDHRQDPTGLLATACQLIERRIANDHQAEARNPSFAQVEGLAEHYRQRMSAVSLQSLARHPRRTAPQASTL